MKPKSNLEGFAQILDLRMQCRGKKVTIIGDIPGCYDELCELLDAIDWSAQSHVLVLTGDLIDRVPKIKETLMFAMNTPCVYSLMSNHEKKLLRYLRGIQVQTTALVKTIEQCGETFLRSVILEMVRISSMDSKVGRHFIYCTCGDTSR
jgi:hypothetical protein